MWRLVADVIPSIARHEAYILLVQTLGYSLLVVISPWSSGTHCGYRTISIVLYDTGTYRYSFEVVGCPGYMHIIRVLVNS